jgi:hypothetical protein
MCASTRWLPLVVYALSLIMTAAVAAQDLPPINKAYPYPYKPQVTQEDTLYWTLTSGNTVDLMFPVDIRYGELRSTSIEWQTNPGTRTYTVTVPVGPTLTSLHIQQLFTFSSPELDIEYSNESGPTFTNAPCPPDFTRFHRISW